MKGKILVVDDEEVMRRSLVEVLRLEGHQVSAVENGRAALEVLGKEDFDLVVLDLKMPGIDGVEVMRVSRQKYPDMQIILLTAHGSLESAIEALRLEAHDYLLKPVSPQLLLSSIDSALTHRAEMRHRRLLLHQMESSLQQLKGVEGVSGPPPVDQRAFHLSNGVMIDLARREIWRGYERANLTPTEGALMRVLMENRGRVLTHRELVFLVQGYETTDYEAPEVLRPLVSRLRRKLAIFGGEGWIANVRGTGYIFMEEETAVTNNGGRGEGS